MLLSFEIDLQFQNKKKINANKLESVNQLNWAYHTHSTYLFPPRQTRESTEIIYRHFKNNAWSQRIIAD